MTSQQTNDLHHKIIGEENLQHVVSEILLAASGAFIALAFLFVCYDGPNNLHWPLPTLHIAVGTIPPTLTVFIWRNYIFYRLQYQDPRQHHRSEENFVPHLFPWAYRSTCIVAAIGMLFLPIQFLFEDAQLNPETGDPFLFSVMCGICFAFVIVFIALNVLSDILSSMGRKCFIWTSKMPKLQSFIWQSSRQCAKYRKACTLLVTTKVVLGGVLIAREDPIVNSITVPIPQLPASIEIFRIIQLTDMHIGVSVGRTRMERTIQIANDLCDPKKNEKECDLIALTGDFIDGDPYHLAKAIAPLRSLGSFSYNVPKMFVTGNHEHLHYNVHEVIQVLSEMGIDSLMNDNVRLPKGKSRENQLVVVGLDDLSSKEESRADKAQKAFYHTEPGKDTIILLAHQPNYFGEAELHGADLMLSGHTHAGQMFPLNIVAWMFNSKYSGYYPSKKTAVYVSAGTHWYGPPVRFTTHHHEITDIRLTRGL